jgi:hypothetical protein
METTLAMTPDDRIRLAHSSGISVVFYERVRRVRTTAAEVAAGEHVDFLWQLEIRDLSKIENTFLRAGIAMESLLGRYPEDTELRAAILAHDARRTELGL